MKLNALWVGGDLTYIEQLCLTSALRVGHEVDLWAYEQIGNVPAGVKIRDAREVMPESMVIWHKQRNTPGVGADLFRIFLQKQARGCYIDCDLLFLKPILDAEYIFCWDTPNIVHKAGRVPTPSLVNNAVLKLPSNCPIIDSILALAAAKPIVPPWWPLRRRVKQRLKALIGRDRKIDNLPWITLGPSALTHFTREHRLLHKVLPSEIFYPVPPRHAAELFAPSAAIHDCITDRTVAVHLWHSKIGSFKNAPPPVGSFMHEHWASWSQTRAAAE